MTTSTITRTATADGYTLTTADLTDPSRLPVTARVRIADNGFAATITISDATGEACDPCHVEAATAYNVARRMLAIYGAGA